MSPGDEVAQGLLAVRTENKGRKQPVQHEVYAVEARQRSDGGRLDSKRRGI